MKIWIAVVAFLALLIGLAIWGMSSSGDREQPPVPGPGENLPDPETVPPLPVTKAPAKVAPGAAEPKDEGEAPVASISGTVRTVDGYAVRNLEFLVVPMTSAPDGFVTAHLLQKAYGSRSYSRVTTDQEGRFEAPGLGPGTYGALAHDRERTLLHERLFLPGDVDVAVLAVRAHAIIGRVRDARTGGNLREVSAELVFRTSERASDPRPVTVRDGRLHIAWDPRDWASKDGYSVEVAFSAEGYVPGLVTATFPPGKWFQWFDAGLEPVGAPRPGTALLEVVDSDGVPVDLPLTIRVRDSSDRDLPPSAREVEELGRGQCRVMVPPGRWKVQVSPRDGHGWSVTWSGEVVVPAEGRAEVVCKLPPFGTVMVRRASFGEGSPERVLSVESADERSTGGYTMAGREMRFAVAPGKWKIRLKGARHPAEVEVTVEKGVETLVEFTE